MKNFANNCCVEFLEDSIINFNYFLMKKLFRTIVVFGGLIFFMALFTNQPVDASSCEDEVTLQQDDGWFCDPAGSSCIVVWGCPADK